MERLQQRLVLCLDGTWNQSDSGTNIYHLSNLIKKGSVSSDGQTWRQRIYYQEGVGTGVLDRVTGGAFGIGISRNIREAYDWLVERYCDGDEIYIFGFSRGAFTARSLVGLISRCGLLRRGAPMPPEELWRAYQILGRHCNERSGMEPSPNWWERIWGKPEKPFRDLQELRREDWEKTPREQVDVKPPENRAEQLLVQWSRRVPIHCVGVFDTVGALGLNALAIPWVRDVTAQFHDARLNTLVTNGFHALAIDEHRASFAHVPWYRETGSGIPPGETANGGRLEQRWFTGAHSNVGGGYEDDVLSQHPLAWMIEKVKALGLEFRTVEASSPDPSRALPCKQCLPLQERKKSGKNLADQAATLRDSFSELAGGIWKHFIRAKREYRRMAPPSELQNGRIARSLNETLDPSVLEFAKADSTYMPPNLWRYHKDVDEGFPALPPVHRYSDPGWRWWAFLLGWLALIALAGWKAGELLDRWLQTSGAVSRWLALAAPLIALLVDWRESVLNHKIVLEPDGLEAEKRRAWKDVYMSIRLGALTAAVAGLLILAFHAGWTWLRPELPPSRLLLCLLALDLLWIYFQASRAWAAGPMTDAGLGSIVPLQLARSPETVQERLAKWADHRVTEEGRGMLAPVVRSLWRDMLAFIPAYTVTLFLGSWLALSLGWRLLAGLPLNDSLALLSPNPYLWGPALAGALLCALADYLEDWSELRYVRLFPEKPSRGFVRLTFAFTCVKYLLFSTGLSLAAAATLGLVLKQLMGLFSRETGTISFVVAGVSLLLVFTTVKDMLARDPEDAPVPAKGLGGPTLGRLQTAGK